LIGRQVAFGGLIANLEAEIPVRNRRAQAAEDDRAGGCPAANERRRKDRAIGREELAGFAVAPGEDAGAGTEVRRHRVVVTERQKANGRRERNDAQLEVLFDFTAVLIHEIEIDRRHGARLEADAEAALELVAQAHQVLAADGHGIEVVDVEREKTQVVDEHIVGDARVGRARAEPTQMEAERLLSRRRRRPGDADDQNQNHSTHGVAPRRTP
jgi:hypothetical protein